LIAVNLNEPREGLLAVTMILKTLLAVLSTTLPTAKAAPAGGSLESYTAIAAVAPSLIPLIVKFVLENVVFGFAWPSDVNVVGVIVWVPTVGSANAVAAKAHRPISHRRRQRQIMEILS
jgi:hypothetical protein